MNSTEQRQIVLNVPVLARVEGEGALDLTIQDNQISDLKLIIFEPPRFFEKFAEGRDYHEMPDLVARICGICPVAYQMSAVHALEAIFGTQITPWIRTMRRLLYCGEWLESHNLHMHLLAAPDFLGYNSVAEMAQDHPTVVRRGLEIQGMGNSIVKFLGGRSVHPVGIKVGGFHRAPSLKEAADLLKKLEAILPSAEKLVGWAARLHLPDDQQDFVNVSVSHPKEYPMNEGNVISSDGLNIPSAQYEQHFAELHVAHSTALHSTLHGKPYLVGPLARLNLNVQHLPLAVRENIAATHINFPSRNMFHSIVARAIETHYAIYEAIRILKEYELPDNPYVPVQVKAGIGYGCTEAPRGMLWHRWEINETGQVNVVKIVAPTSQNQARIEEDLRLSLQAMGLKSAPDALRLRAETVIRNYDPCISCSTHFLKLSVKHA